MPHGILFFCTRWGWKWDTLHALGLKVHQVGLEMGHLARFRPESVPGGVGNGKLGTFLGQKRGY